MPIIASVGLGLEAQQEAVRNHLNGGNWRLAAEVEIESGKRNDRPKLAEAINYLSGPHAGDAGCGRNVALPCRPRGDGTPVQMVPVTAPSLQAARERFHQAFEALVERLSEYLRRDPGNSLRRWLETRYRDAAVTQQDAELLTRLGFRKSDVLTPTHWIRPLAMHLA